METKANYVIVGLFTIIAVMAAFGFVYWTATIGGREDFTALMRNITEAADAIGRRSSTTVALTAGEHDISVSRDWLIERGLSGQDAVYVHAGGCWNAGKRSKGVDRSTALHALTEGVRACPHCRPDTELGYLEG